MTMIKRKNKGAGSQPAPMSSKRARLLSLSGDTLLTKDHARKLKMPDFIATLEVRQWKQEASLVRSYFQHTNAPESTATQLFGVLNGALHRVINHEVTNAELKKYSAALIRQFETEKSKQRLNIEYKKLFDDYQLRELEKEAQTEARFTSRILTTVEARYYRKNMQHRLDQQFSDDETDQNTNDLEQLDLTNRLKDDENPLIQEKVAQVQEKCIF
ncbi:hypothetical protein BY458DRAFT_61203 [Sporodiniella umbellata]|nr:hypothetical protein BY458DRAFT_61203 [Sporodiniella umbellata]